MTLLERLKELLAQATPGPWEIKRTDVGDEFVWMVPSRIDGPGATVVDDDGGMCPYNEEWETKTLEANAELIVTMRNNAEALIEVVEAAKVVKETYSAVMSDPVASDIDAEFGCLADAWNRLDAALAKLEKEGIGDGLQVAG